MNAKERIQQISKTLTEANYRYYVLDDPTMPDFEYDRLLRELELLEQQYPEFASMRFLHGGKRQAKHIVNQLHHVKRSFGRNGIHL